jgi:hypothetical protein
MSLLDDITGGANQNAQGDLANILAEIQGISTPTSAQLQLSPLAQYASTGELNPALMAAAQAGPSAYNNENLSSVPNETMQKVLSQEAAISDSNGMTPQEQAQIAQAEQAMNTNVSGQRGAIAQDFAGRGVPASLISAALQNATVGQDAQQAYQNALQGQASAANNALTAMNNEGALAGQMFNQNAGQANTVAAAQNALNQFNAQNTQQANVNNQANQQAANTYDTTNKQNISNQNITGQHQVQIQNQVEAPQEAASLALQKAGALSNIGQAQSNQQTAAGQQAAGLFGGLLGAGATVGASAMAPGTTVIAAAEGGEIPEPTIPPVNFLRGGPVPGNAQVAGDSRRNDTVPARLSPGEFVVPRTAMARPEVRQFLAQNVPTPRPIEPHPSDVASVMKALSMLRGGA